MYQAVVIILHSWTAIAVIYGHCAPLKKKVYEANLGVAYYMDA